MADTTRRRQSLLRFKPAYILLLSVAVFGPLLIAVAGYYTLGWSLSLNSYEIWAAIVVGLFCVGMLMVALPAILREGTPHTATPTGAFLQGDVHPIDVHSHFYPIDEVVVKEMTGQDVDPTLQPGMNSERRQVSGHILPLGGLDNMGFHIKAGGEGFLVYYGRAFIELGDAERGNFLMTPRIVRQLDYDEVPPEVLAALRWHPKYKEGRSPIFELWDYSASWVDYVCANIDELNRIASLGPRVTQDAQPDAVFWQTRYHSEVSKSSHLSASERELLDSRAALAESLHGQAEEERQQYSEMTRMPPGVAMERRKPMKSTEQ